MSGQVARWAFDEEVDDFRLVFLRRNVGGRLAFEIDQQNVRSRFEERLEDSLVAVGGGVHQGSALGFLACIDIDTELDQEMKGEKVITGGVLPSAA